MDSFYRRFITDFSTLASPLNEIVKKNVGFKWGSERKIDRCTYSCFTQFCQIICDLMRCIEFWNKGCFVTIGASHWLLQ